MKNMFKIAGLSLAVLMLAFAFAGCGKKDDGNVYKIVSDNAFKPFEYLDAATNTYVGFDMDLLAAIAADQGFKYTVENVGFDAALGQVQAGQADAVIAGMTIKPDRAEIFEFSDGYFDDGQIRVVAADSAVATLDDLKGKVVATKAATMGLEYAESVKNQYGFTTMMFEGSPEMCQAVAQGTCVACFEDRSVIGAAIKDGQPLKVVGDVINPASYGFGVKKGENADLIKLFNAGLANVKASGKYEEIAKKYGMLLPQNLFVRFRMARNRAILNFGIYRE